MVAGQPHSDDGLGGGGGLPCNATQPSPHPPSPGLLYLPPFTPILPPPLPFPHTSTIALCFSSGGGGGVGSGGWGARSRPRGRQPPTLHTTRPLQKTMQTWPAWQRSPRRRVTRPRGHHKRSRSHHKRAQESPQAPPQRLQKRPRSHHKRVARARLRQPPSLIGTRTRPLQETRMQKRPQQQQAPAAGAATRSVAAHPAATRSTRLGLPL